MSSQTALADLIRQEIRESGPIPFRRFMELALYHPEHGYYASGKTRIGKEGDFITNVSVGPFFGRLLAHYFVGLWEELGRPQRFDLVEIGASHGQLFSDVLAALKEIEPRLSDALRATIVEPFPRLRAIQQERLGAAAKWVTNLQDLGDGSIVGAIWSNELFDALPVHRLKKFPHGWGEMHVGCETGELQWSIGLATYDQDDVPPGFPVSGDLPADYVTELWPHSEFWAGELARVLARGKILTIDYGLEAKDLYAPHRKEGTLQAYHRQKRSANLLDHIGEQDITAHVNFTALIESGKQAGLRAEAFSTQERFLMGVLKTVAPDEMQRFSDSEKRQLNMLIHPDILGHVFKVLVQSK